MKTYLIPLVLVGVFGCTHREKQTHRDSHNTECLRSRSDSALTLLEGLSHERMTYKTEVVRDTVASLDVVNTLLVVPDTVYVYVHDTIYVDPD
jgi:hypothetical protein